MKSLRIIVPCALMIACGLVDLSLCNPTIEDQVANIVVKNVKGDVSDAKVANVEVNSGHSTHPESQIFEHVDKEKKLEGAETSGGIKLLAGDEHAQRSSPGASLPQPDKLDLNAILGGDHHKIISNIKEVLEKVGISENQPLDVPLLLAEAEKQFPGISQLVHNAQLDLPAILAGDYKKIIPKIQEELKKVGISENHPFNFPLLLAEAEKQYPGLFQLLHNIERPELKSVNGKPVQRSSLGAILPQPDQPDLPAILAGDYKNIVSKIQEDLKKMGISENHPFNFPLLLAEAEKQYPGLLKLVR